MEDSANLAVIVGIYVTLIGTAWGASSTPFDGDLLDLGHPGRDHGIPDRGSRSGCHDVGAAPHHVVRNHRLVSRTTLESESHSAAAPHPERRRLLLRQHPRTDEESHPRRPLDREARPRPGTTSIVRCVNFQYSNCDSDMKTWIGSSSPASMVPSSTSLGPVRNIHRVAHRRAAVAAPAGLVEHQGAVRGRQVAQQRSCGIRHIHTGELGRMSHSFRFMSQSVSVSRPVTGHKWDEGQRGRHRKADGQRGSCRNAAGHRASRNGPGATATKRGVTPGRTRGSRGWDRRHDPDTADQKKPIAPSAYDTSRFFVCW